MEDPYFRRDFAKVEAHRQKQRERAEAMRSLLLSCGGMEMIEQAKDMYRKIYIHVGLTNSGKTYDGLQALKRAESGAYLGPLRLLALEVFDTLNEAGVPCSLLTGEERIDVPFSNIVASTIEMCDYHKHYDVVVIDEAHLVADRERGSHWTRAILSIDANEIHICTAPEGLNIIENLIKNTGAKARGVKTAQHVVTRTSEMPAVLIELGFLTNLEEAKNLLDDSYRDLLASAIAAGVIANLDDILIPPKPIENYTKATEEIEEETTEGETQTDEN